MRGLFATAELAPFVKVGGLGDAASGLVKALRRQDIEVEVVLPDYGWLPLEQTDEQSLDVPDWAGPARVRRGSLNGFGNVSLVVTPTMARPHPYNDAEGRGWPGNDTRFFSFSAAVAALAEVDSPDVLHLNDWHSGAALGFLSEPPPTVLTIHNLAYQGAADGAWLDLIPYQAQTYEWYGGANPLTGSIALADRVVTVSPTFAAEALRPATGFGAHDALAARGNDFSGILNGIDTEVWNPAADPYLPVQYDVANAGRKREIGRHLAAELSWEPSTEPIIGVVTRLTDQKGVDLALEAAEALPDLGARMVLLGSGDKDLTDEATQTAGRLADRFAFLEGYDEGMSHRIFGAADLYLMPSRFEPAGLTQMQAMRYGAIPVVTDVGGLHDTVTDADADGELGNGFVAETPSSDAVADALERAVRAWRWTKRRGEIRRRGMSHDWSWDSPATQYRELYKEITSAR
ncbi:MAG TPA: glycogen/starch synthase [Acidimicrobiia bacterium]|nr:glycogen/starch synthase [Acidimicrobiia bacterium]